MENMSKAFLIASAIIIAVMLISLTMFLLSSIRDMSEASSAQAYTEQIEAYNRFFQYSKPELGDRIKGYDVFNIIGKAIDLNQSEWSLGQIEIDYLGTNYTDYTYEQLKFKFDISGDKALMNDTFEYDYYLDTTTGVVYKVSFKNRIEL